MWRIGIAFLFGHCGVHALSSLPPPWLLAPLAALAVGALWLRKHLLLAILLGFGWAWSHAYVRLSQDLPTTLEGRDLIVTGRIASMLDARDVDPQFDLEVIEASEARVPARIRLTWYDTHLQPQAGELWRFVVRLKRRNGFANPGGFDYEGHLFRAGIGATGYVRQDELNGKRDDAGASHVVLRARSWIGERIAMAVGASPMLGILQGLAVGDTQAMTPEQWRVFAATGTTHLMAISGLHISMVAALAALAGGSIARWRGAQRYRITAIHGQVLAGGFAALTYSLLAGMSVPTQRTLAMLCIYFCIRWYRRELSAANALGASLVCVLTLDPFAPLSVGAWLSFGAVATILLATSGRLTRSGAVVNFARVQVAVTLGLMPLVVFAFGGQSLISPFANAIAVPLFTLLIVPLILCGTLLACLWLPAGSAVLGLASHLLGWSWPLLQWLAERRWAMWYFAEMPVVYYGLLAFAAFLLIAPSMWTTRAAAGLLCVPIALFRPEVPAEGEFQLAVLDVGQGLAIVVQTQKHALVYDAGPAFRTGRDTGELVVAPYLRARGIRALDRLIISHGDLDHAGGMRSVLSSVPVETVLLGPSVADAPANAEQCAFGQRWQWDGVWFEVLHPQAHSGADDNDTSCVLRVAGSTGSALLTGDIEAAAENELVARQVPETDVVIVAHHGSRSSSTAPFVAATRPRLAIVSAGYRNRWGFPKLEVRQAWQSAGAKVLTTIEAGAIEVTMTHNGEIVREHRRARRRYWSAR